MRQPDLANRSCAVHLPSLTGHVDVAGLWFPAGWFDQAARRRRMLAGWQPRARVFSFAQGDLLRFAVPHRHDCATLPGWPLVLLGGTLTSAGLSDAEAAALPAADAWIIAGAQVLSLHLRDAQAQDPSTWIEASDYSFLDTYDCRDALPESVVEIGTGKNDVRQLLGDKVPPASAQREAFLRELKAASAGAPRPSALLASRATVGGWLQWWPLIACLGAVAGLVWYVLGGSAASHGSEKTALQDWLLALVWVALLAVMMVRSIWGGLPRLGRASAHRTTSQMTAAQTARTIPPRGGWRSPQQWRNWLARAALFSRASRLLGRQHASYLRRMMMLFEEGKLDEALRHAIPLGGDQGSLGQAFGALQARRNLALSQRLGAGTSVQLGDEISNYLKNLYQKSFEELDRAARVDEAVFVLAELLQNRQEALDYLEKHERYQQAAELALAWDRPADVIVRLYCLAGDWRVAVAVARRDRAFANAVLMLEKKWPDPARRLRLEWAQALAAKGDWLDAVDAAWPVPEAREQAAQWLQYAEAQGGTLAARALVQRALLLPDTWPRYADTLQTLRLDAGKYRERAALAHALLAMQKKSPALASLARTVAGPILADQSRGVGELNRKMLQNLVNLTGDRLLQADLPNRALPVPNPPQPLNRRTSALVLEAPSVGVRPILDAVPLDGNRYLVALGEAGVAVIDVYGAVVLRFAVPAEMLVISDNRQVVLALARRRDLWRVSRIELAARYVLDLGLMPMDECSLQFDGIAWTVVHGAQIRVFDASRAPCAVLWQVTDLPGSVRAFTRTPHFEQMLIQTSATAWQLWRYSVPHRRLIARDDVATPGDGVKLLLDATNGPIRIGPLQRDGETLMVPYACNANQYLFGFEDDVGARLAGIRFGAGWLSLSMQSEDANRILRLQTVGNVQDRVRLRWPVVSEVRERFAEDAWLVFDSAGRLLHVDLRNGESHAVSIQ